MLSLASPQSAVVLLSGGLDSATTLAYARHLGYQCHALSFDYGQRHVAELLAAEKLAVDLGALSHRRVVIDMGQIGGSSLTDFSMSVPEEMLPGIPSTYVPARNTVFLSYALALAEVLNAQHIFIGVNAVDYSGYPDCRPAFIEAFEQLANVATKAGVEGKRLTVHAPLLSLSKSEIIRMGTDLGVDFSYTVSCYQADENGRACGKCDSCRLRAQGFVDADLTDITCYR